MKVVRHRRSGAGAAVLCATLISGVCTLGCGDDGDDAPPPCNYKLGETCVGVTQDPICDGDFCSDGAACAQTVQVSSGGELLSAAAGAASGTCILAAPGAYPAVDLPGGVSLLGKGASSVSIGAVSLGAGAGAMLRGLHVSGAGVTLDGAQDARIEQVRISSSPTSGIELLGGSAVAVASSEILGSTSEGIRAIDSGDVSAQQSVITDSEGPAILAQCTDGCACASMPSVDVEQLLAPGNAQVGLLLLAVTAALSDVEVSGTRYQNLQGGGGIYAGECSTITAEAVRVEITDSLNYGSFGLMVSNSHATLGAEGETRGIVIVNGRPGMWIAGGSLADSQQVTVRNFDLATSTGVGMGFSGSARGIVIVNGRVADTVLKDVPARDGQLADVGDGLSWSDDAMVQIDGLALSNNARQSVLIDGSVGAGSSIANVTLSGLDASSGILQQGVDGATVAPTMGAGAPALSQDALQLLAVPAPPATPAAN